MAVRGGKAGFKLTHYPTASSFVNYRRIGDAADTPPAIPFPVRPPVGLAFKDQLSGTEDDSLAPVHLTDQPEHKCDLWRSITFPAAHDDR
jgi:hypothetical protein